MRRNKIRVAIFVQLGSPVYTPATKERGTLSSFFKPFHDLRINENMGPTICCCFLVDLYLG
jgi:hypothetical protein